MTAGDQDNRRRFVSGLTSLFGSDGCGPRRRAIWSTACWRRFGRLIGSGDNLVLRTGLTIQVASGSRMRGKGKSRNDEELLHGRAPFIGSLFLPQPDAISNVQRKGKNNRDGLGVPTWRAEAPVTPGF